VDVEPEVTELSTVAGPAEYVYDAAGRLVGVVAADGESARYVLDGAGNVTSVERRPGGELAAFSIVPVAGRPGDVLTVHGTGLEQVTAATVGGASAAIASAAPTALTLEVPAGAVSGDVVLSSGASSLTAGQFTVSAAPPVITGLTPASGSPTTQVVISGSGFSSDATLNAVSFGGVRAEVVAASATSLTTVVPYRAGSGPVQVATPAGAASSPTDFAVPLPGVDPASVDSLIRLEPGAVSTPVSMQVPGKVSVALFDAPASGMVNIGLVSSTFSGSLAARVYSPAGDVVGSGTFASSGGDLDLTTLHAGQTYSLVLDPAGANATGQVQVTISEPLFAELTTDQDSFPAVFDRPGQDLRVVADLEPGWVSLGWSEIAMSGASKLTVLDPNGAMLQDNITIAATTADAHRFHATTAGRYTFVLDPGVNATGTVTLTVAEAVDGGTLSTTAAGSPVVISRPGQEARLVYPGQIGEDLTVAVSGNTVQANTTLVVTAPDGTEVARTTVSSGRDAVLRLPALAQQGDYSVVVSPRSAATGSMTLTLSAPVDIAVTPGQAAIPGATSRPGQVLRVSTPLPAGQGATFSLTGMSLGGSANARVLGPDGTPAADDRLLSASTVQRAIHARGLTSAGTYVLEIIPQAAAPITSSVRAVASQASTVVLDGPASTVSTSLPGEQLIVPVTVPAGAHVSLAVTSNTIASTSDISLLRPDGSVDTTSSVVSSKGAGDADAVDLTAGTYTFLVAPQLPVTGSTLVTLSTAASASPLGSAGTVMSIARAGQNVHSSFAADTGQRLRVSYSASTLAGAYLTVRRPDGSVHVNRRFLSGASGTYDLTALTQSGTYRAEIDAQTRTGSITLAITPVPGTTSAPAGPAGSAQAVSRTIAAPTSNAAPLEGGDASLASEPTWVPDEDNLAGVDWNTRGEPAPSFDPLLAPDGRTALSGRVLTVSGAPLAGVTVTIEDHQALTDDQGRFLLSDLEAGASTLEVDGRSADEPGAQYPVHQVLVDIEKSTTTVLPYTIWLTQLDTTHTVQLTYPTTSEVVLRTPDIPGLEVRLPAGSTVRDEHGDVVDELGITAVPIDRPPFPLPEDNEIVPVFFTVQPGGSYVFPEGAQVIYPNYTQLPPGTEVDFWDYDPEDRGWYVYGSGSVSADATQVVPDDDTRVWAFHGSMFNSRDLLPFDTTRLSDVVDWLSGDPVEVSSGHMVETKTDLALDDVMPIELTRSYWQGDGRERSFGQGWSSTYGMFLHSQNQYQEVDLYLPGGATVHYTRTSPGTGYYQSVFTAVDTPGPFQGSTVAFEGTGWTLETRDGTEYVFPMFGPLQVIRDRSGNEIHLTYSGGNRGALTQITSPSGRWIRLTSDSQGRVTGASDNAGRTVSYAYDAQGRLSSVTDPAGEVSSYTYDQDGRILTATDARGIEYLTNTYDTNGRVAHQELPEGITFDFDYTTGTDGRITATEVTDGAGAVHRYEFSTTGAVTKEIRASGTGLARTVTYERGASDEITAVVDPLGRRTEITRDTQGRPTNIVELAGTPEARSARTVTYGAFDLPTTITDAAGNTTTYGYDTAGRLTTVTDAENRTWTYTHNQAGQILTTTDPSGLVTTATYVAGDLVEAHDGTGASTHQFVDAAGRVVSTTNPLGVTTSVSYDALNQILASTDGNGTPTTFSYDENGNLLTLEDGRGNLTTWSYDDNDQAVSSTDPLGNTTTGAYDTAGRPVQQDTPAGRATTTTYDLLGRVVQVAFTTPQATSSNISYEYAGNGLVSKITDSASGVSTFTYDTYDHVQTATQPDGEIEYTYDTLGRVTSTTLDAGTPTQYTYDDTSLPITITQGAAVVTHGYDPAGRRTSTSLPGGWQQSYSLDATGQTTAISYTHGGVSAGDLTYTYDAAGHRTSVGGSFANIDLPQARASSSYDQANQLTAAGPDVFSYDPDGFLVEQTRAAQTSTLTWNARGELETITGTAATTADFDYDGFGRRSTKTVDSVTTELFSLGLNVTKETEGSNPSATLLSGGTDEWFSRTTGTTTTTYLTDALGSPLAIGGADGQLSTQYTYDPYGVRTQTGTTGGDSIGFTGREDDGTGLMYYRARYYDPTLGRFISRDPIGIGGGTNLYQYAAGAPTNYTDPSGNNPLIAGCLVGGLSEGAISYVTQRLSGRKVNWGWGGVGGSALAGCATGTLGGALTSRIATLNHMRGAANSIPASTVRFSQSSVNGADAIEASMRANGWMGDAIDVVRMPDGGLTSLDNTRLLAANRAGIDVRASIRGFDDTLPSSAAERFATTKGGVPSTWGDAVINRIGNQNRGYRTANPFGSWLTGWSGN
jgi:RHS repeat-associated protein